jgi:hypothetical protein
LAYSSIERFVGFIVVCRGPEVSLTLLGIGIRVRVVTYACSRYLPVLDGTGNVLVTKSTFDYWLRLRCCWLGFNFFIDIDDVAESCGLGKLLIRTALISPKLATESFAGCAIPLCLLVHALQRAIQLTLLVLWSPFSKCSQAQYLGCVMVKK